MRRAGRRGPGVDTGLLLEDASKLTADEWGYVKVPEKVFYASTASSMEQLTRHIEALTK